MGLRLGSTLLPKFLSIAFESHETEVAQLSKDWVPDRTKKLAGDL